MDKNTCRVDLLTITKLLIKKLYKDRIKTIEIVYDNL